MKNILWIAVLIMAIGLVGCMPPPGYYHARPYDRAWGLSYNRSYHYDHGAYDGHGGRHDRDYDHGGRSDRGRGHDYDHGHH